MIFNLRIGSYGLKFSVLLGNLFTSPLAILGCFFICHFAVLGASLAPKLGYIGGKGKKRNIVINSSVLRLLGNLPSFLHFLECSENDLYVLSRVCFCLVVFFGMISGESKIDCVYSTSSETGSFYLENSLFFSIQFLNA